MGRVALALCVSFLLGAAQASGLQLALRPIVKHLSEPVWVTTAPGDDKLYIVEQKGRILTFDNGKLGETPFLDIVSKVKSGGEMGLLSVVFHPSYQRNGRYFVNYTHSVKWPDLKTIIEEYSPSHPKGRIILTIKQPYANHNGGQLAFGPDGMLYIGMGDGGSAGDPDGPIGHAQDMNDLLGKMLRINVDGKAPYEIPSDNPFKDTEGVRPEIWASGLRNPWRFSFDRKTGALFAGDVGQGTLEEIDIIEKGHNYGWRTMEGTLCFNPSEGCDKTGLTLPIYEYGRDEGGSITGGFVYRGKAIPEMDGVYFYADFNTEKIWGLTYDQRRRKLVKNDLLFDGGAGPVSSFGEDADGEILVVSHSGTIFRVLKRR